MNMETNISTMAKALDAFGKDQIPFATANALTSTAFVIREHIVERTYPEAFTEVKPSITDSAIAAAAALPLFFGVKIPHCTVPAY